MSIDIVKSIFYNQVHCIVNKHYCFLKSIQTNLIRSPYKTPKNIWLESYRKYTENVHETQLGHGNKIPILLSVTELDFSLSPDVNRRYVGFIYADGKTINQIDDCKSCNDELFHIWVIIGAENMERFIPQIKNIHAQKSPNSEKVKYILHLDICFEGLDAFIDTMCHCYETTYCLCWVQMNKMNYPKWKTITKKFHPPNNHNNDGVFIQYWLLALGI